MNDAAPVNAGGGMLKMTNAVGAVSYSQTMGQLTTNNGINVNSSVTNIGFTNDMTAAGGTQMLTFQRFTQNGQSTVNFYSPAGLDETNNIIQITGVAADVVMGPWATTGTGINNPTDYAFVSTNQNIIPANIPPSDPSNWIFQNQAYTLGDSGNLTNPPEIDSPTTVLAMRYSGTGNSLTLNMAIQTNGILNGGTGPLTINGAGPLQQTTGSTIYFTTNKNGGSLIINAPISAGNNLSLVAAGGGTTTIAGGPRSTPAPSTSSTGRRWCWPATSAAAEPGTSAPATPRLPASSSAAALARTRPPAPRVTINVGYNSNGGDLVNGHQMIITGGSLQYGTLNVGFNANNGNTNSTSFTTPAVGTLTINGGTLMTPISNDNTYVGWGPGARGTINIISGSWGDDNVSNDQITYCKIGGYGGTGIVNQSGGTAFFGNFLMIPFGNNPTKGSSFPVEDGSGTYNISGGTIFDNATLGLCYDNNTPLGWGTNNQIDRCDNGTMNVSGSGLVLQNGEVDVGATPDITAASSATGTLNILGGEFRQQHPAAS